MIEYTTPIAESNNFIILDTYHKATQVGETYQSEQDLENEFINDLRQLQHKHFCELLRGFDKETYNNDK